METRMTSLEDQPEGRCVVTGVVAGSMGSNAAQSLEARARF